MTTRCRSPVKAEPVEALGAVKTYDPEPVGWYVLSEAGVGPRLGGFHCDAEQGTYGRLFGNGSYNHAGTPTAWTARKTAAG